MEREASVKLCSEEEDDEEVVEAVVGMRDRFVLLGQVGVGWLEVKTALPRFAAWVQATSSRGETRFATMATDGPSWRYLAAREEVGSHAQRRFRGACERRGWEGERGSMPNDWVGEAAGASSICVTSAFELGAGLPLRVQDRLRLGAYDRSLCVHRESSRDRLRL